MKVTIIILTILYLVLTIIANCITRYRTNTSSERTAKYIGISTKASVIEGLCRVMSYAIIIIDVAFILAFFL